MKLNELSPAVGSTKEAYRKGRGHGSGNGKTSGKGMKGQNSRSGGGVRTGFEGGQMPLQRRLPKVGFRSKMARDICEVLLYQLEQLKADVVDFEALKAAGLITTGAGRAKVVKKGELTRAVKLRGVAVTAGARAAIEAAGGSVE